MNVTTSSPKVIVKYNESVLKEVDLDQSEFTIGRKADNRLVIEDSAVSGHHARLVKIQSVFFLEDLGSTNGTFVNDQRVDRQQLKDMDVVGIGKHRLIFRDTAGNGAGQPDFLGGDRTMILKTQKPEESRRTGQPMGSMHIVAGRTDRAEYHLTSHLTVIGSQPTATIRLKGWFAPKTAAMIGRRGDGYYITACDGAKHLSVNAQPVKGQTDLKEGDVVEVAGVKMYFSIKPPSS
jgi:pSer/pThr/pTyr-binding forkhead associated (FHA) protein